MTVCEQMGQRGPMHGEMERLNVAHHVLVRQEQLQSFHEINPRLIASQFVRNPKRSIAFHLVKVPQAGALLSATLAKVGHAEAEPAMPNVSIGTQHVVPIVTRHKRG